MPVKFIDAFGNFSRLSVEFISGIVTELLLDLHRKRCCRDSGTLEHQLYRHHHLLQQHHLRFRVISEDVDLLVEEQLWMGISFLCFCLWRHRSGRWP